MESAPENVISSSDYEIMSNLSLQELNFYFEILFNWKKLCLISFRTTTVEIQLFLQMPVIKFQLPKLNKHSWALLDVFTQSFSKIKEEWKKKKNLYIESNFLFYLKIK